MRARLLLVPSLLACSPELAIDVGPPCTGLLVDRVDQVVAPPAHVSTLVRVGDCSGAALGGSLDERDFSLFENDRPVSVFEAPRSITPATRPTSEQTAILLDLSGSIVRSGMKAPMIDGARALAMSLIPDGHRVAVYGFDGRPDLIPLTPFGVDPGAIDLALDAALKAELVDDSTNLNGAVVNALKVLDEEVRLQGRDGETVAHGSLVVFTDGIDQAGRVSDAVAERSVEASSHSVFAIGVGPDAEEDALSTIGRAGTQNVGSAAEIDDAFDKIGAEIKSRAQAYYLVNYCSPGRAGERTLTIRVTSGDLYGEVDVPYSAEGFGAGCAPEDAPMR